MIPKHPQRTQLAYCVPKVLGKKKGKDDVRSRSSPFAEEAESTDFAFLMSWKRRKGPHPHTVSLFWSQITNQTDFMIQTEPCASCQHLRTPEQSWTIAAVSNATLQQLGCHTQKWPAMCPVMGELSVPFVACSLGNAEGGTSCNKCSPVS